MIWSRNLATKYIPALLYTIVLPTSLVPLREVVAINLGALCYDTEFFDRYFHISLPIVTKHELGLPFPHRKLPIKCGTNPSTIFLVILVTVTHWHRQTDRQTHTQTNGGENIFPRFRRIIISFVDFNLNPIKKPNSTVWTSIDRCLYCQCTYALVLMYWLPLNLSTCKTSRETEGIGL